MTVTRLYGLGRSPKICDERRGVTEYRYDQLTNRKTCTYVYFQNLKIERVTCINNIEAKEIQGMQ